MSKPFLPLSNMTQLNHVPPIVETLQCNVSTAATDPIISPHQQAAVQRLETLLRSQSTPQITHTTAGQIASVQESTDSQCHYTYDAQGDLAQIIEPNGQQKRFEYDNLGRLTKVIHPDGDVTTYRYSEGHQARLCEVCDRGLRHQFTHDDQGHLTQAQRGNAGAAIYRYNNQGQLITARTAVVSTQYRYNDQGQIIHINQNLNGVSLQVQLHYNSAGRLAQMTLPGSDTPVNYQWTESGWPQAVTLGETPLAHFEYTPDQKLTSIHFANGIEEWTQADPVDSRPLARQVRRGDEVLWQRSHQYTPTGQISQDGHRAYKYDVLGRLTQVEELSPDPSAAKPSWHYHYDGMDNRIESTDQHGTQHYRYDSNNRLIAIQAPDGSTTKLNYDRWGRLCSKTISNGPSNGQWIYRYNDAHQLIQVRHQGTCLAQLTYDHKGRLVLNQSPDHTTRYLYGPDDTLLAITDAQGQPQTLYIRTPLGLLAEIHGSIATGTTYNCHHDDQGTRHLVTNPTGQIITQHHYDPFGLPSTSSGQALSPSSGQAPSSSPASPAPPPPCSPSSLLPLLTTRPWFPSLQLYYFGCRWYAPDLGRFLTPDSYTGAADDERLVNPISLANRQFLARAEILPNWLKDFRVRNRYTYCRNDPVNHVDPNGHWSFGGVLLSILGAIWTLPNTLIGLLLEITCLVGEVIRWLVWLVTIGHVSWETPGFDAAASGRLNAFALVFEGGWLGSFPSLLGITFGNVFFVYKKWQENPDFSGTELVYPPAYNGTVGIPRNESLYEHELRHTNQYAWFGPFFHLGLPIWGVYLWDVILNGYENAWLERDARDHAEGPTMPPAPPPSP
ncbi:MAG: hypothetical protein F6K19_22560 [Cyanothece sp. SIO1E1]|nr:hypothetical protein [Cyanothece sp. SIO1E1]